MNLAEQIKTRFPNFVTEAADLRGEPLVHVKRESIRSVASALKTDPEFQFDLLMDLFGLDFLHWEEKALRFEVVYSLYSSTKNHRLFLKVSVPEKDAEVDTVSSIWPAADWYEREVWDMFGVTFKGHPNLKRLLMYEEFRGHALRKDYAYNQRQPLIPPLDLPTEGGPIATQS